MTGFRPVYVALAVFVAGFAVFPPRLLLVVDEDQYVSQAVAFAQGGRTIPGAEVLFPPARVPVISDYPPGTSLLQTPFVWLGGWRLAALASVVALVVATLATARWVRVSGGDPAFALLLPGFVGAAFFGRVAMSDLPATALVALTGLLLVTGKAAALRSAAAGCAAGLILLFREPVLVLVAPLLAGEIVRRRRGWVGLMIAFATAATLRPLLSFLLFGTPWHLRDPGFGFSLGSLAHTLPLYLIILGVLLPAGFLLPFFYRGDRRVALVFGVLAYVSLFLAFEYDGVALNGPLKGVILTARYMAPAMPLFAVMASDVWPRWHAAIAHRLPVRGRTLAAVGAAAAIAVSSAVHPIAHRQEAAMLPVGRALLANTRSDVPVLTNVSATLKYFSPAYSPRRIIVLEQFPPDSLVPFSRRHPTLAIALLDRSDSRIFTGQLRQHDEFLERASQRCTVRPVHDERISGMRVRVLEASACR